MKSIRAFLREHKSIKYQVYLAGFSLTFLLILISGFNERSNTDVVAAEIGVPIEAQGISYTVLSRQYDPEKKQARIDFWVSNGTSTTDLYKVKLSAKIMIKGKSIREEKGELIRTDQNYYTVFIENVISSDEAIRTDISLLPEMGKEDSSGSTNNETKIYSILSDFTTEAFSIEETDRVNDSLKYQIVLIEDSILDHEKQVEKNKERITALNTINEEVKADMAYQVGEQLEESQKKMDSNTTEIASIRQTNQELRNTISEEKSQVQLIEEKIKKE